LASAVSSNNDGHGMSGATEEREISSPFTICSQFATLRRDSYQL
jgi:hypothetical protein